MSKYYKNILLNCGKEKIIDSAEIQELPAGYHFGPHMHPSAELFVCMEGSIIMNVRQSQVEIGEGEYIPNMKRKEGMEIAKRIARLPYVTGFDFCVAFGIPVDKKVTPKWYVYDGSVYLSSPYPLGEEYIVITEEVFEKHKEEAE